MKRFLQQSITLYFTLAALCAVMVIAGRAHQPLDSAQLLGFDTCRGMPCYAGITPGVTRWSDAGTMLTEHMDSQQGDQSIAASNGSPRAHVYMERATTDSIFVNYIEVSFDATATSPLLLGSLVQHYGLPCSVSIYNGVARISYPSLRATVNLSAKNDFAPESRVANLLMRDGSMGFYGEQPNLCIDTASGDSGNVSWLGFASRYRYTAHRRFLLR